MKWLCCGLKKVDHPGCEKGQHSQHEHQASPASAEVIDELLPAPPATLVKDRRSQKTNRSDPRHETTRPSPQAPGGAQRASMEGKAPTPPPPQRHPRPGRQRGRSPPARQAAGKGLSTSAADKSPPPPDVPELSDQFGLALQGQVAGAVGDAVYREVHALLRRNMWEKLEAPVLAAKLNRVLSAEHMDKVHTIRLIIALEDQEDEREDELYQDL